MWVAQAQQAVQRTCCSILSAAGHRPIKVGQLQHQLRSNSLCMVSGIVAIVSAT